MKVSNIDNQSSVRNFIATNILFNFGKYQIAQRKFRSTETQSNDCEFPTRHKIFNNNCKLLILSF